MHVVCHLPPTHHRLRPRGGPRRAPWGAERTAYRWRTTGSGLVPRHALAAHEPRAALVGAWPFHR